MSRVRTKRRFCSIFFLVLRDARLRRAPQDEEKDTIVESPHAEERAERASRSTRASSHCMMPELTLEVIPVIDLKGKQVVRAKMGERHLYAPLASPLAASSAPRDVVAGFLSLHPFTSIYIADLDAIEGIAGHEALVAELEAAFPQLQFWVDPGLKTLPEARAWLERSNAHAVIGSETWQDAASFAELRDEPRVVLSLDFRGEAFQGPPGLLDDENLWPQCLIVMTLSRVGSNAGPDVERLANIIGKAGSRKVYAAGGLRGKHDLAVLRQAHAAGVLVASALHDGRLKREDLSGHGI